MHIPLGLTEKANGMTTLKILETLWGDIANF